MPSHPSVSFFPARPVRRWRRAFLSLLLTLPAAAKDEVAREWDDVARLRREAGRTARPRPADPVPADRAEADRRRREQEDGARRSREVARAARDFASRHGAHPRAQEASKVAILADLDGILPRDPRHAADARSAAEAFRRNPRHPPAARAEVALALEQREIVRQTLGRPWHAQPVLAEGMLDRLRGEFGDRPELWQAHLALATGAAGDAGREAAQRVHQAPGAAPALRAAAREVLERHALVRQALVLTLTPAGGRPTPLDRLAPGRTVICLYDAERQPLGPPGLHALAERPPARVGWIYVALGRPAPAPKGARSRPRPEGVLCLEPAGWRSPVAAALRVPQLPYAFVLDERQRVWGFGRPSEIPALLAGIGRPLLP
jgi:hypothetical protein